MRDLHKTFEMRKVKASICSSTYLGSLRGYSWQKACNVLAIFLYILVSELPLYAVLEVSAAAKETSFVSGPSLPLNDPQRL